MLKVIGVRFKKVGRIYFFEPDDSDIVKGDKILVDTVRGRT